MEYMAGCEGDLQSIFTLLAVKSLTGKDADFMANPSMINARTNELYIGSLYHRAQTNGKVYISAIIFENGKRNCHPGIAPDRRRYYHKVRRRMSGTNIICLSGTLSENTNYINMCRTQVRIRMNTPAEYFLKNPLGNHHILVHGNYEDALNEFFLANACKRTE